MHIKKTIWVERPIQRAMMGDDNVAPMAASDENLQMKKIIIQIMNTDKANTGLMPNRIPNAVATPLPPLN
jgi:hypothetical protein